MNYYSTHHPINPLATTNENMQPPISKIYHKMALKNKAVQQRQRHNVRVGHRPTPYQMPHRRRKPSGIMPTRVRQQQDLRKATPSYRVGNYTTGKVLGQGSFGKVYEAWHNDNGNQVAIKATTKTKPTVFETQLLKRHGHHPNIIGLHELVELQGSSQLYVVMERATMDLHTLSRKTNVFISQPDALQQVMKGLLSAVQYLHEHNVAHMDIKPENIMVVTNALDGNGRLIPGKRIEASDIRLADFGLCQVSPNYDHDDDDNNNTDKQQPIYLDGSMGTPTFWAPEMKLESDVFYDGKVADMWSVGMTMLQWAGYPVKPLKTSIMKHLSNKDMVSYKETLETFLTGFKHCPLPVHTEPFVSKSGAKSLRHLLFQKFLTMDVKLRITAEDALRHEWLDTEHSVQWPDNN